MSKPIQLIDGNNAFMRLYSLNPSYNLFMMQLSLLEQEGNSIWFWDGMDSRKYRREIYPEYKAKRTKKPQDSAVFELMRDYKQQQTYPRIEIPEWEADDVIAYMAKRFREKNPSRDILIISTDADFKTLNHSHNIQTPWVKSLTNIHSAWMTLYKSLVGDVSDNIKGCKGFGDVAWDLLSDQNKQELLFALEKDWKTCPNLVGCKHLRLLQEHWPNVKMAYSIVKFRYDDALPSLIEEHYVVGKKAKS